MNVHGHICSHQPSPNYQTNGIIWRKPEVKHSYSMNSEKILSKISTLYHKIRIWLKQQSRFKNLYSRQKTNPYKTTDRQWTVTIYKLRQYHNRQDYSWKMEIQKGKALDGNQTMSKRPNLFVQSLKWKQPTNRIPAKWLQPTSLPHSHSLRKEVDWSMKPKHQNG